MSAALDRFRQIRLEALIKPVIFIHMLWCDYRHGISYMSRKNSKDFYNNMNNILKGFLYILTLSELRFFNVFNTFRKLVVIQLILLIKT